MSPNARSRLDTLIRGPVQRTYLMSIDGFWAERVLDEFVFAEDRGFVIETIHFHQQGDFVRYRGPHGEILLEFFPDGNHISATVALAGGEFAFSGEIDRLAVERTNIRLPSKLPLNRRVIAANVHFWADVLRSLADELLGDPVAPTIER